MNVNVRYKFLDAKFWEDVFFLEVLSENVNAQINETKEKIEWILDGKNNKELNTKLDNLEKELTEIKNLKSFFEIFYEFSEKSYSNKLERMPSLFIEDRKKAETLNFDILDLITYLDCSWDWLCFDHHSFKDSEEKVATSVVIDFIKKNPRYASIIIRIFEWADANQIAADFKKYIRKWKKWDFIKFLNYIIPITKWYIDTDAVLAHFSFQNPKKAVRYEKLLTQAAMRWDLNLEVSSKAKRLNDIVMWVYVLYDQLKQKYKKYLNLQHDENTEIIETSIANFETIMWNAIVKMVSKMIDFIEEKTINNNLDDKYYKFFSRAQNIYSWIVDEKTEEISRYNKNFEKVMNIDPKQNHEKIWKLEKDGLIKIETQWQVISYICNKNIGIDYNWIPPSSFFKHLRTNENIDSSNLKYNIICTIKCMDEESTDKAKYISISNIANNVWDLKKYSLKSKFAAINDLEIVNLENLLQKKKDDLEKLQWKNWTKSKWKVKWLEHEVVSIIKKINYWKRNWVFNYRNWLIFCSSSYSSLSDIVQILNEN